jgi:hypothetical protein
MKGEGLFPSVRVTEKGGLIQEIGETMKIAMDSGRSENMDTPCRFGMKGAPGGET